MAEKPFVLDRLGAKVPEKTAGAFYNGILDMVRLIGKTVGYSKYTIYKTFDISMAPAKSVASSCSIPLVREHSPTYKINRLKNEISKLQSKMGVKLAAILSEGMMDPTDDIEIQEWLFVIKSKKKEIVDLEHQKDTINETKTSALENETTTCELAPLPTTKDEKLPESIPADKIEKIFLSTPKIETEDTSLLSGKETGKTVSQDVITTQAFFDTTVEAGIFQKAVLKAQEKDPAKREAAIQEIKNIINPAVVQFLVEMTKDPVINVRSQAYEALIIQRDGSVYLLFEEALKDRSSEVRLVAVKGIYELAPDKAFPGLINALEDTDSAVRLRAVTCLKWIKAVESVPYLIPLLKDPNVPIRKTIINILENMKKISVTPNLIELFMDENIEIREYAYKVLKKITKQNISFDPVGTQNERIESKTKWENWWNANMNLYQNA